MFVAENDPGARPPCRLIHLVEGGDYGYQRLYGRAPFHPFVCWNGQLRSTLPMITGTGEAPCGIAPLGGGVLVPSWGDHRIDFFPLVPKGASFTSSRIEIVTGGDAFRPVCIVQADDYTYYLSDWVHGSYELHQRGRVWKLEIDPSKADWLRPSGIEPPNAARKLLKRIQAEPEKLGESRLFELAASGDAFLSRASILGLAKIHGEWSTDSIRMLSDRDRITAVLAARVSQPKDETMARSLLSDPNPDVVFEAIRWISDEDLVSLKDQIGAMFMRPNLDFQLFEASLAAWNRLNGNPRAGIEDVKLLVDRVQDETATPRLRAFALRLLPPKTKQLRIPLLRSLISLGNAELTLEAIRTLAGQESDEARRELEKLLGEPGLSDQQKAECVLGLAAVPEFHQPLLVRLAVEGKGATQREALRALRIIGVSGDARQRLRALDGLDARTAALRDAVLDPGGLLSGRPEWENEEEWSDRLAVLPGKGNASEGRRLFFHPRLALCSSCHRYEGRGKILGPELSAVAERGDHRWLLESLMQPNREVAPQFFSWTLQLKDGSDFTGITLRKGGRSGKEFYRDLTGEEQGFLKTDIVGRRENQSSLMPTEILAGLTDHEIRDLMTFLSRN